MSSIQKFIKRVEAGVKSRSKDIRFPLQEAQQIANELTISLERENELLKQIIDLQKSNSKPTTSENTSTNKIIMDGGSLKD